MLEYRMKKLSTWKKAVFSSFFFAFSPECLRLHLVWQKSVTSYSCSLAWDRVAYPWVVELMRCVLSKIRTVLMYKKVKANLVLLQLCPVSILKGIKTAFSFLCSLLLLINKLKFWAEVKRFLRLCKRCNSHRWVEHGGRFCMGLLDKADPKTCVYWVTEGISCWGLWPILLCRVALWNIPQRKGLAEGFSSNKHLTIISSLSPQKREECPWDPQRKRWGTGTYFCQHLVGGQCWGCVTPRRVAGGHKPGHVLMTESRRAWPRSGLKPTVSRVSSWFHQGSQ